MPVHRPPALFLHSAFRSGSTWFWNKFRQSPHVCAYYEPFNEALATLDPAQLAEGGTAPWPTGHPVLNAPYYAEYAPLLRPEGGGAHFDPRFSYEAYFDDGAEEEQRRYIANLISHATTSGTLPVLGFCRSLVRLPWFRRQFEGVHIATWRNPWDQWASCHDQAVHHKNAYFEFRAFLIASIGVCHDDYHDVFGDLQLPPFLKYTTVSDEKFLYPFFYATHVNQRFRIFLRVFLLDMLTALTHADVVVDLDRLGGDPAYRQEVTTQLRDLSGLDDLSFDDCALPRHPYQDDGDYVAEMDEALAFLDRYGERLTPGSPELTALGTLKARMAECRQKMAEAAATLPAVTDDSSEAEDDGFDRLSLCHVLFAARRMVKGDSDPTAALTYLRSVYGADFAACQAGLAEVAEFVQWLGGDPAYANERVAAGRLGEVLRAGG
ncbi:MAG TPA: hypothetical protein VN809_06870 [Telmatospirillum sp.]|nr:hypothetical protein [Telmatospirillum sp.]